MTPSEARNLSKRVAEAASNGDVEAWSVARDLLMALDGRSWLTLDQAARKFSHSDGTPVSGTRGWLGSELNEPSGVVAVVTSLHVDGRFRQRAALALGECSEPFALSALAVRLLDHVPQVREQAWPSLSPRLTIGSAERVLDVLLAGRERQHANAAIAAVQERLLETSTEPILVSRLMASGARRVRRYAYTFAHNRGLLSPDVLVAAVQHDPDQWLRTACADWLTSDTDTALLLSLVDAESVEGRLVAVTYLPDALLTESALGTLLLDKAPRVREQAGWRARRIGLDLAGFYRRTLADTHVAPRAIAACLDALGSIGDQSDLPACARGLRHRSVRVRASAAGAFAVLADREHAVETLTPLLLDESARVCSAAARSLAKLAAPPSLAERAWTSEQPWSRRAAWRLAREAGDWVRVEADLRAGGDSDPQLAALGQAGIRNWLEVAAATTWRPLAEAQKERLAALLPSSGVGDERARVLAFHAGVSRRRDQRPQTGTPPPRTEAVSPTGRWWRAFWPGGS